MSDTAGPRPLPQDQSSGSGRTASTASTVRHVADPAASKRVCFYKSGDPQFSGQFMVVNNRTFKSFDALLDSLSKKVPLPFGVRNITTPGGVHAVHNLDDLEDGKAYICSDRRKVKPINLALANKKLPPWYHARPVTARRRVLQLARLKPDRPVRRKDPVAVRMPKRLVVFRNGDPGGRRTVMLQKRTTPTFEALLSYVSEVMQFPVVKLHMPDGRRVDGLPALILCSGVVVAAGREAFKPDNYKTQKPSAPTWLPPSRRASNRKKPATASTGKKKSLSSSTKSRNFSASSERYFVNQIHNSIAGSLCDLHSNPTGSVELETGHLLESVAETETEGEGGDIAPSDDIEKSFRVNQDGSMTVEMKVRLTIKEEETLHWTTTLTRSSVASQLSLAYVAESEPETHGSPDFNTLEQEDHNAMDTIDMRSNSKDDNDVSPNENNNAREVWKEEDDVKPQTDRVSPRRIPTPGPRGFRQKQASVESLTSVTGEEVQENTVGSYSYRQETENGAVTEEYCMVKQSSTTVPVPKPRRAGSVEINNYNNNRAETFTSTGVAEILTIEDSGEKVTETVLHIYEQQTCQDNFVANSQFTVQGVSVYGRPATSDTAHFSSCHGFEMEMGRPSTASESVSKWRADMMSPSSDFIITSLKAKGGNHPPPENTQGNPLSKPIKESSEFFSDTSKDVHKTKRKSSKPKARKKLVRQSNGEAPDDHKKGKPVVSSAGSLKKIYGFKSKTVKSMIKQKKKQQGNGDGDGSVISKNSGKTIKFNIENPNKSSTVKDMNVSEDKSKMSGPLTKHVLDVVTSAEAEVKGTPKRQRSVHQERRVDRETHDLSASMTLPALNSSSSVINEYVEHWLEKAHADTTVYPEEENHTLQTEAKRGVSEVEKTAVPNSSFEYVATQRTLSSANSATIPSVEKPPQEWVNIPKPTQQSVEHNLSNSLSLEDNSLPEAISVDRTMLSDSPSVEDTPIPIKVSVENMSPLNNLSLEKTSLPGETPTLSNSVLDLSSLANSPSPYLSSSPSSLPSEDRPSICSASEEALSPTVDSLDKTISSNHSAPKETPLHRNPSMKKARFISNHSLEKKMSLKRASLEKSAITSDCPLEKTISSTPIKMSVEKTPLSNRVVDVSSLASSPVCTSPNSLMSEDRPLSIPSSEGTTSPTGHSAEETLSNQASSNNSALKVTFSPNKPSVKRTQSGHSNLSLEKKKRLLKKTYSEKSESPSKLTSENTQASSSPALERTPLRRNRSLKTSTSIPSSPSIGKKTLSLDLTRKKTAPGSLLSEKVQAPQDTLSPKKLSPYSQSLQAVSPPMKPKLKQTSPSRNKSLDTTTAVPGSVDLKKSPKLRNRRQTLVSSKSMPLSPQKTPTRLSPDDNDKSKSRRSPPNNTELHKPMSNDEANVEANLEEEQEKQPSDVEQAVSSDKRESTPEGDQSNSEEEQPVVKCTELQVNREERASTPDEGQARSEEELECQIGDQPCHEKVKCLEEFQVSSEEREFTPCSSEEEQVSYTEKQYSFEKEQRYIEEGTSEEDANYEMTDEKPTDGLKETPTRSVAERVSLLEKQVAVLDQRNNVIMETSDIKQFAQMEVSYISDCDDLTYVSHLSNEQSQIDEFMRGTSEMNTTHNHIDKNREEVPVNTSKRPPRPVNRSESSVMSKKSALESSSLAFSYDSNRCLSVEPDGNRVKSIKEMFLAKSVVDIQYGQKRPTSPNTSDLSDYRPETSDSGGHRTSTEISSGEDDSFYKSIARGFVRRTIEMLYGKREIEGKVHDSERPPTAPKLTLAALSPFSLPRCKAKSDLSYFSATGSFETYGEQTRCLAFDVQVRPGDVVPIDQSKRLLRENSRLEIRKSIRKSISEPVGIHKNTDDTSTNIENVACHEDTKEDVPYSLFGPESPHTVLPSDLEDKVKSEETKCTYFNLRRESDSDLCQDELSSIVSSSGQAEVSKDNKDTAEDTKTWAEKNGTLPGFALAEFKMPDNKVHPLVEGPEVGQVVVVQPGKGKQKQTVNNKTTVNKTTVNKTAVNKRPQEPDALEIVYLFCGQHCPVL